MRRHLQPRQGSLFYEIEGDPHRPALMLLHPWPWDGRVWAEEAQRLQSRYCVLRPDWPGCAPEEDIEQDAASFQDPALSHWVPLAPAELAGAVVSLLNAESIETAIVAGCSLGGYVLYELLRLVPARVRAAVICDSRPEADADGGESRRQADAQLIAEAARFGPHRARELWSERLIARQLGATTRERRPAVVQRLRVWALQRSLIGAIRLNRGMALRRGQASLLPSCKLPVLVIAGEEDAIWPQADVRQTAAAIPGASLSLIPEAGHLPMLENPAPFQAALDRFLQSVTR